MSTRIKANTPFLHLLARSGPKRRKNLLKQATKEELSAIFEICLNILRGNLNIKGKDYTKLKRQRQLIRKLADKKVSVKQKKVLVNQKGGFIGTLAAVALPALAKVLLK